MFMPTFSRKGGGEGWVLDALDAQGADVVAGGGEEDGQAVHEEAGVDAGADEGAAASRAAVCRRRLRSGWRTKG